MAKRILKKYEEAKEWLNNYKSLSRNNKNILMSKRDKIIASTDFEKKRLDYYLKELPFEEYLQFGFDTGYLSQDDVDKIKQLRTKKKKVE